MIMPWDALLRLLEDAYDKKSPFDPHLENVETRLREEGFDVVETLLHGGETDERIEWRTFDLVCSLIARGLLTPDQASAFTAHTTYIRKHGLERIFRLNNALKDPKYREIAKIVSAEYREIPNGLTNLFDKTPQEWDATIASELREAGIDIVKFREYDTPGYWPKHTLKGKLGKWAFSRDILSYALWGDVPLATAEAIAEDPECAKGCMPGQWLASWGNHSDPAEEHSRFAEYVSWIEEDGTHRWKEDGQSDEWKKCMEQDFGPIKFVEDPSAGGKPFIQTYTFFTLAALKNFVSKISYR